jgi:hypothetical protein
MLTLVCDEFHLLFLPEQRQCLSELSTNLLDERRAHKGKLYIKLVDTVPISSFLPTPGSCENLFVMFEISCLMDETKSETC